MKDILEAVLMLVSIKGLIEVILVLILMVAGWYVLSKMLDS